MRYSQPTWKLMEDCGSDMPSPFRFTDVSAWFADRYPDVPESTLRTHLAGLTEGVTSRHPGFSHREPVFRRLSRGVYEFISPSDGPGRAGTSAVLFALPSGTRPDEDERRERARTFADSKRQARRNGERWFALSSHYGLIQDHDPSPSALFMGTIPEEHGDTWASWVSIRLESALGSLRDVSIRLEAPRQYVKLLRPALLLRGAVMAPQEPGAVSPPARP